MLKTTDREQIGKYVRSLQREAEGLINEAIRLSYFMRGAIQYEEIFYRTYAERRLMEDFIESRLETESKKMFPVY